MARPVDFLAEALLMEDSVVEPVEALAVEVSAEPVVVASELPEVMSRPLTR